MRSVRLSILAAILAPFAPAAPTVSNIRVDGLSHSSLRLIWDNSTEINAVRVRYGYTMSYDSGPGGGLLSPGTALFAKSGQTASISGLAPGQSYHFCPQSSSDRGLSWSPCVDAVVTMLDAPENHPALPVAPQEVDLHFPAQTGAVRNVAPDCSDLQEQMNRARAGDTILIPAGTICGGSYTLPKAPEAIDFTSADVNTQADEIAIRNHGFSNGQKVHFDSYGCLPGSAGADSFCQIRGVLPGSDYFIDRVSDDIVRLKNANGNPVSFQITTFAVNADGTLTYPDDSTVLPDGRALQVRSSMNTLPGGLEPRVTYYVLNPDNSRTIRLARTRGGPAIFVFGSGDGILAFTDAGSGTHSVMAWPPPNDGWIVVRTGTPEDRFCPEGVRCLGALWGSKMARFMQTARPFGDFRDVRLNTGLLSHHWRFIGIEFTHADNSAEAATTTDPKPYYGFLNTRRSASHIVFDRCYIHGLGAPNRVYRAIVGLDGEHVGIINSDLEKLDYWHPYVPPSAFAPNKNNPQTVEFTAGTFYLGTQKIEVSSPTTVSLSGFGSGLGVVYMTLSGSIEVLLPPGLNGTCTSAVACSVQTATTPAYPYNAEGRIAVGQIADLAITDGAITSVVQRGCCQLSVNATEGAQSMIAGNGPGPVILQNNRISASGLPIHFDDSGGSWYDRHDYVVRRNYFSVPLSQQAGGPESDGLRYFHRHLLEWKGGQRILVEGNVFEHNFADVVASGVALLITPRAGGYTTDVMIRDNVFRENAGGIMLAAIDSYNPVSKPLERVAISNNLFYNNDAFKYVAGRPPTTGILVNFGYAAADFTFDHNTFYDNRGNDPSFLHLVQQPMEGVSIIGNFLWINDDAGLSGIGGENVGSCTGNAKNLLDCALKSGDQTSYVFTQNLLFPGWRSSSSRTTLLDPTRLQSAYAGLPNNWVVAGDTLGERLQAAGIDSNFRFAEDSSYAKAASGRSVGADMDRLTQAQGLLGGLVVDRNNVHFTAPDPGAPCWVLYGTGGDISTFARTPANTAYEPLRTFTLDGMLPSTTYTAVGMCSGASNYSIATFLNGSARRR